MSRKIIRSARIAALLTTLFVMLVTLKTPLITSLASELQIAPSAPVPSSRNIPDQSFPNSVKRLDSRLASSQIGVQSLISFEAASPQEETPPEETSCSQIWNAYPAGGYAVPDWLYSPPKAVDLATDNPYVYLAGKLLQNGLASAPDCPFNGLLPTGLASQCGVESARSLVTEWQNQFDGAIHRAAVKNGVPSHLLKNIFAQESQFWVGQSDDNQHFGVGQMTEGGLDPLFLAYPEFYQLVCTDVLSAETCQTKYPDLSNINKGMIRGYFLRNVIDVSCPDCPKKFDEKKANDTIDIFAKLIVANCQQVGNVIVDITEQKPGTVSIYDDLWRYTLLNYNGGSGCVSGAIETTYNAGVPVNWSNVSDNLKGKCQNALDYVEKVSR